MKSKLFIILLFCLAIDFINAQNHKAYYKNGQLREIGIFKNEKEIGEWKWYFENGQLESVGSYEKGHQTGQWKEYFSNGKLRRIRNFNNGFLIGKSTTYHLTGRIMLIGSYDENGEKIGVWKKYNSDEKLIGISICKNGKEFKNGAWKYYDEDGKIKKTENYNYGVKTGKWKIYDYYGNLYSIEYYKNGKETGEWKTFNTNGQIESIKNFSNGKLNGLWKVHYSTGIVITKNYKDDRLHGEWNSCKENGDCFEIGYYKYDEKHGNWIYFYDNEQIKKEQLWKENKLMEVISYFDEKGILLDKGTVKEGNGTVKEYYADGELASITEYINGKKIDWNNSGQLNNLAWDVYENETNNEMLKKAIEWVQRSIELDENYYNTDTYAALLYKTGKYKQALILSKEAINIAKKKNNDYRSTTKLIEQIYLKMKKY